LVHDADERQRALYASALGDLAHGLRLADLWLTMGWFDIRQRYSRSVMGPLWVSASLAIFVTGLGFTYAALFHAPIRDYLPYVTVGMVTWSMLAGLMNEGCAAFTGAVAAIKQMPVPPCVHVFRTVWRSLIIFAHNGIIMLLVLALFGVNPGRVGLLAFAGLALLLINGIGFAITFGTISARFRDVSPLMANVTQMLLFVTPVLWRAQDLGERGAIAELNPLFHLIELVRAPLLSASPSLVDWSVALAFTLLNLGVALAFYARFRWRIAYWL
jgi:ABC-2 type transport system permease protein/lipopolysaccharide transport system permease protein